ncbi:Methyltransferase-like protein 13 [Tetrabaena socialis]|uniref:Methyltransferase-like protein 13 n=1 Tax=Tetrabaena socialis TaxID=47790 RepID=A0A2J8ACH1_9CHLO|nr:Methyltransferase-like protein 13 [Tetrabaena socialis]|eukprot:PNH10207.1 Methyltransferase-like protein 13 [Tetrabaena socialis]
MATGGNDRDRIWSFERRAYWDARYLERMKEDNDDDGRLFDWLCTYEAVRGTIDRHLSGARLAIDIGCGNAEFAAAVCAAHPRLAILGVDYSAALFDLAPRDLLGPRNRTSAAVMDARHMALRPGLCDVVLDKGCLDALCAGWDQLEVLRGWGRAISEREEELALAAVANVARLLAEVERCLAPGGRYICISYEGPAGRQRFFADAARAGLSLSLVETAVEEQTHNYVYVLTRGGQHQ